MPLYEYQCSFCGQKSEILHKISDPDATDCPRCQQPGLQRLVSAPRFKLKGTGWYETDFKTKPQSQQKNNTKETSDDASSSTGSDADKQQTKSDDKT